jgi:predicted dehydrogenase
MTKPLNIGMIGYGFMGRTHTNAYKRVGDFFPDWSTARCSRRPAPASEDQGSRRSPPWGYESIETDWRKLLARDDIDAVDICVPNNLHKEIAIAAAEAGKMISARSRWR